MMKKNKMMRAAAGLLVATLLTTSAISGTFAKYTTEGSGTDTARIAKWGINVPDDITLNLFAANAFDDGKVASSNGSDKVLAPGTENEETIILFSATGDAPEVKYDYTVDLEVDDNNSTIAKLDDLDGFKWTMTKPGDVDAAEYDTFEDLQRAVQGLSDTDVAPNTYPTAYAGVDHPQVTIGWKWDYDDNSNSGANDADDTAAGNATTLAPFTLTFSITATQLD